MKGREMADDARDSGFTHLTASGEVRMVDVSRKPVMARRAIATAKILLSSGTQRKIANDKVAKGNVLATARIAGIQAAKKTGTLIPLCHPLNLDHVEIEFRPVKDGIDIFATTRLEAKTGVEMEALVGATVAALTIYDMCKAIDKNMSIVDVRLVEKSKKPLLE
jgi:cyclic pyranopterin phosphate synthase